MNTKHVEIPTKFIKLNIFNKFNLINLVGILLFCWYSVGNED